MKTKIGIAERVAAFLREFRFQRSLRPGAVSRMLRVPHYATAHGELGPDRVAEPAAVEDRIDAWGKTTLAARHQLAAGGVARACAGLDQRRFGEAEKGYSNVLRRFAARVKTILADVEGNLRETKAQFAAAAKELKRHCLEIAAPRGMHFSERSDALWKAFAFALSVEAFAGAVSTVGELGWVLSLTLSGVLGAVIFALGCGAGWARQHAWVGRWVGWGILGLNLAVTAAVLFGFCSYRLTLADIAARSIGLWRPEDAAAAAALPPLVLLLAVAGVIAWGWTMHVWLSIYGVAPGVRARALRQKRAAAACRQVVAEARAGIKANACIAETDIDRACANAAVRRDEAASLGAEALARSSFYDRDRESIFAVWTATHGEFAGTASEMAETRRAPRDLPSDYPVIDTAKVPTVVGEVRHDADALMLDEGRAKLAVADTCAAGLRQLDRLAAGLPDLSSGTELLP